MILAVLAGVLYFLGFVGFGVWPLIFVFLAVLLLALEGRTPRQAFGLGALTGFSAMCGGYYWVIHLLREFADLSLPLAVLGYILLNIYQGLLWGLVGWLVVSARVHAHLSPAWVLPVAVVFSEWCFPLLFPSFVAASLYRVPLLTQIADLGGPYLVGGLIALINGGIYVLFRRIRGERESFHLPLVAAAGVMLTLLYGAVRVHQVETKLSQARPLKVALIQSNLGARDKTTRRAEFLLRHQSMSRSAIASHPDLELIVWPESAFNRAIHRERKNVRADITVGIDRAVLSGAITVNYINDERFVFNSAVLTSSTGDIRGVFDKIRLVTFGETIPFVDSFPQLKKWFPRTGGYDRGTTFQHLKMADGTLLLPMICFEDLIPALVRELWRKDGAPDVLVNMTNDSWYGDTHEPLIHLALATLRSIETRRALIRSTNTGISAIVDPLGRITHRTGQWTQEILIADAPLIEDDSTTAYLTLGDWPGWLCLCAVVAGTIRSRRRRSRS